MNKISLDGVEACIFDLDGTLLDSMNVWQEVDRAYLERFDIEFDSKYSEEIKKMTFNESAKYFKEKFQLEQTEEEIIADWNQMVEVEYRDNIEIKNGARDLLARLSKENIKMCVATSCNKEHALMALERLDILDYFSFVRTCKDVGKNKAYPDLYLSCAKDMEVHPTNIIVFEDLLAALHVAKKAEFQTCGIYDFLSAHEMDDIKEMCDYYIYNFKNLNIF